MADDDSWTKRRLLFLEDWRTSTSASEALGNLTSEAAIDFALSGIKSAIVLNGGALVAVPAFLQMLNPMSKPSLLALTPVLVSFGIGLAAGLCATVAGYQSLYQASEGHAKGREAAGHNLNAVYGLGAGQKAELDLAADNKGVSDRALAIASRWEKAGFGAAVVSYIAFVTGAAFFWLVISREGS